MNEKVYFRKSLLFQVFFFQYPDIHPLGAIKVILKAETMNGT